MLQIAGATFVAAATGWLLTRRRRCCGRPESCPRLAPGSRFLARCIDSPAAAGRCRWALTTLAMRLLREGAVGHALACAARAAQAGHPGAFLVLSRIHAEMRNGKLAREFLRHELEGSPRSLEAWLALGDLDARDAEYESALLHYRRASECDPSFAEGWCAMGRCYAALDAWNDARTCFEMALTRDPGHLPTLHSLGLVLVGAGEVDEALALFRKILDITGPNGPLLARLGRLARAKGDYRQAVVWLSDAMRLSGLPEFRKDMAELYAEMGQGEIAEFYRTEFEKEYVV